MTSVGKTSAGKVRINNEDTIYVSTKRVGALPNLFIVADGMGGHKAGEVASYLAVKSFIDFVMQGNVCAYNAILDFLKLATEHANKEIFTTAHNSVELQGMGTTFSSCVLLNNIAFITHLGDSRVYKINYKGISQLTEDHTYVNEMCKLGKMTRKQALTSRNKNLITKALGIDLSVSIDAFTVQLSNDDKLLLCSDGLTNMVSDIEILNILNDDNIRIENKVDKLIDVACVAGGFDNISVILIENAGGQECI
jgi:protein phosphatase